MLSMAALSLFEPPEGCPAASCPLGPISLVRARKAPTMLRETFPGTDGQNATLVILASDGKTTALKAWLNGAKVLLPSDLHRSGPGELRLPVTLSEENVLVVRLSGKPGNEVVIWVESDEAPPVDSGDPKPTVFRLTSKSHSPSDDTSGACVGFGEGFGMADWTEVVEAVTNGAAKEDILSAPYALILNNGLGHFQTGFPLFENRHFALSSIGPDTYTEDSAGTEMFWLTSTTFSQPVLCAGPAT
jgi:hypothetical protein